MKQYVRKQNDQNFETMHQLIIEGIDIYKKDPELVNLNLKLWHRFWCCVDMYNDGESYKTILQKLFGAKQHSETKCHKKNDNFNTNIHKEN
jgi:hypothetical protein